MSGTAEVLARMELMAVGLLLSLFRRAAALYFFFNKTTCGLILQPL